MVLMSEFDRVFNLGRAYVGKAQDELFGKSSPETKAMAELNHALEQGVAMKKTDQQEFKSQILAMSDEEAEIIMGVPTKASFSQLKSQYDLLLGHLAEFEAKQPDKKQIALREKQRIEKAFSNLSAKVDSTEKRFGSLEIE